MRTLLHIAPQLPPAIDGVGDYCWNLWRNWPEKNPDWQFLTAHGADGSAAHWPEVAISGFQPGELLAALERTGAEHVVLHYVGYGFQPKGIPVSLPSALRKWREAKSDRRLMTMFHEMYARSSPLRSPFWVAPVARRIIRELVEISDEWATSCGRYHTQLTGEFGADAALGHLIPIGSNIPVVAPRPARIGQEGRLMVVAFGLARTRLWALERHIGLLKHWQHVGALQRLTLLGKAPTREEQTLTDKLLAQAGIGAIHESFDLSADEISHELAAHDCGLLANEPDILTKSGVFAALASHGVVPVASARIGAESIVPTGVIVNRMDGTAAQVGDALLSPDTRRNLSSAILGYAERELDWKHIARRWSDVLPNQHHAEIVARPMEHAAPMRSSAVLEVSA